VSSSLMSVGVLLSSTIRHSFFQYRRELHSPSLPCLLGDATILPKISDPATSAQLGGADSGKSICSRDCSEGTFDGSLLYVFFH
jgi:hypothetical protein